MPSLRRPWIAAALALAILAPARSPVLAGDQITLKNGVVYQGTMDKDGTVVSIFDGLKRIVIRDSRIAKSETDPTNRALDRFSLVQPMEVHSGQMPIVAVNIEASEWDDFGRRTFSYVGSKSGKVTRMTQAISELGPYSSKIRGVDGFWVGQIPTSQIPRRVVLGLLSKIDQKDQKQRLKVCRFLIQAEWFAEANVELDKLARDFRDVPETRDLARNVKRQVQASEATRMLGEIEVRLKSKQPKEAMTGLRNFPRLGVPGATQGAVRDLLRSAEAQVTADRALADEVQAVAAKLPTSSRAAHKSALLEILKGISEAPDAVRGRLEAFQKAGKDKAAKDEARFALALSGWCVGSDSAVNDLPSAEALWKGRRVIQSYLMSREGDNRGPFLDELQSIETADPMTGKGKPLDIGLATKLARFLPPPLRDDREAAGEAKTHRVLDDPNQEPTEYVALLPPEYHPLRRYATIVALHSGKGPMDAVARWGPEAARRGYIVIAPEYNPPGRAKVYRYTSGEHAAVELALRDARKRFAIDGDRVFLAGQLEGANMAWDLGISHPDLFAGIVAISGLPARYVGVTEPYLPFKRNARRLPLYAVAGDLAPATEMIFNLTRELLSINMDVTFVEYYWRGLEDFPEEVSPIFDWMAPRVRDPHPKGFEAVSARECDDRFYGIVIREFSPGKLKEPETVDPLGKNLNPATIKAQTSTQGNLLRVTPTGVKRLDIWLSPKVLDFERKVDIRVGTKRVFFSVPKPDFEPFLEDLRIRGDREQYYWLKVPVSL